MPAIAPMNERPREAPSPGSEQRGKLNLIAADAVFTVLAMVLAMVLGDFNIRQIVALAILVLGYLAWRLSSRPRGAARERT